MGRTPGLTWKLPTPKRGRRLLLWLTVYPFTTLIALCLFGEIDGASYATRPTLTQFLINDAAGIGGWVAIYLLIRYARRDLAAPLLTGRGLVVVNRLRRSLVVSEAAVAGVTLERPSRWRKGVAPFLVLRSGQRVRVPRVWMRDADQWHSTGALATLSGHDKPSSSAKRYRSGTLPSVPRASYKRPSNYFFDAMIYPVLWTGTEIWKVSLHGGRFVSVTARVVIPLAVLVCGTLGAGLVSRRKVHRLVVGDHFIAVHRYCRRDWDVYPTGAITAATFRNEGHRLNVKLFGHGVSPKGRLISFFDHDGRSFTLPLREMRADLRFELERVLTEGHALPVTLAAVLGDRAVALSTSSGPAVLTANYISGAT